MHCVCCTRVLMLVLVQMSILDGNLYDTRSQEAGQELEDDLEASQLLLNNRQQPLLIAGGAGQHTSTGKVVVQLSVSLCPPASCHSVLIGMVAVAALCGSIRPAHQHWQGRGTAQREFLSTMPMSPSFCKVS